MARNSQVQDILREISGSLSMLDDREIVRCAREVAEAPRVFLFALGRTLLMMRAFAMRLAQLGVTTYVVGDVTIPAVGPGDLIILGSASGETDTTFLMAEKAKRVGARIGLVTSRPESRISRLSDFHLEIHAQAKTEVGSAAASSQPMATLFEQSMLIALDAVVLMVMKTKGISAADMLERHFNLE